MKKSILNILILFVVFILVGCDRSYLCTFDINSLNENIKIVNNDEELSYYSFSSDDFNRQPKEYYSNINFFDYENDNSNAKKYKFEIKSLVDNTYNLSLILTDDNKIVRDLLRVGLVVDNKLYVYKYYDKNENIYHKENEPNSLLHFNSKTEIFNDLKVNIAKDNSKEIILFIWIEESELYDSNGERYKGWDDKSYQATPIMLNMDIK